MANMEELKELKYELMLKLTNQLNILENDLLSITNNTSYLFSKKIELIDKILGQISKIKQKITLLNEYYVNVETARDDD